MRSGSKNISDPIFAHFSASVVLIDGFIIGYLALFKGTLKFGCKYGNNVIMQSFLIAFARNHVIGFFLDDFLSNGGLTSHGVDGNRTTGNVKNIQKQRNSRNFIRLVGRAKLSKNQCVG